MAQDLQCIIRQRYVSSLEGPYAECQYINALDEWEKNITEAFRLFNLIDPVDRDLLEQYPAPTDEHIEPVIDTKDQDQHTIFDPCAMRLDEQAEGSSSDQEGCLMSLDSISVTDRRMVLYTQERPHCGIGLYAPCPRPEHQEVEQESRESMEPTGLSVPSRTRPRTRPRAPEDPAPESKPRNHRPHASKRPTPAADLDPLDHGAEGHRNRPTKRRRDQLPPFACPFWKKDAQRYRQCCNYRLTRIGDVKQHITRKHRLPLYCAKCYTTFSDEQSRDRHTRQLSCDMSDAGELDGVTEAQMLRLRRRVSPKLDEEEQWYHVFSILFSSDVARPASPFNDLELSEEVLDLKEHLLKTGPDAVLKHWLSKSSRQVVTESQEAMRDAFAEGVKETLDTWISSRQKADTRKPGRSRPEQAVASVDICPETNRDGVRGDHLSVSDRYQWLPVCLSTLPEASGHPDYDSHELCSSLANEPAENSPEFNSNDQSSSPRLPSLDLMAPLEESQVACPGLFKMGDLELELDAHPFSLDDQLLDDLEGHTLDLMQWD